VLAPEGRAQMCDGGSNMEEVTGHSAAGPVLKKNPAAGRRRTSQAEKQEEEQEEEIFLA
jgi:hypothetical protein